MLKRALLVYRWCFDPAGKQVPPSFLVGYTIIFIFVFALPDYLSHDEPAEQDPLMSVDWSEAAAVNARFRARALAGTRHYAFCIMPERVHPIPGERLYGR